MNYISCCAGITSPPHYERLPEAERECRDGNLHLLAEFCKRMVLEMLPQMACRIIPFIPSRSASLPRISKSMSS